MLLPNCPVGVVPRILRKSPGASGAPTWLELSDELYSGLCLGARAHLCAHAPLACGRPWLIPSLSPTLKKAAKTIKGYGWDSGPCFGATVGQVWNS